MTTISAVSILASQHANAPSRVDTLLLRYPRFIHAEFMTHRAFSRNSSSSRAIPVDKMIKDVFDDPVIPLHWGKNQKGMQAGNDVDMQNKWNSQNAWNSALWCSITAAKDLARYGIHKQIVNRLLEPFAHITVVVTATEWNNFFALRDHPDAEPHMRMLAQAIRKAREGASVQTLELGQWHLPFVREEDWPTTPGKLDDQPAMLKLSVARCASTSYKTVEGYDMTLERAIALYDKLVNAVPMHASPLEHQCEADDWIPDKDDQCGEWGEWWTPELHGNFVGFCQYRKILERRA